VRSSHPMKDGSRKREQCSLAGKTEKEHISGESVKTYPRTDVRKDQKKKSKGRAVIRTEPASNKEKRTDKELR